MRVKVVLRKRGAKYFMAGKEKEKKMKKRNGRVSADKDFDFAAWGGGWHESLERRTALIRTLS
jgi:hypothetical protein